jgi:hypothetical protein
MGGAHVALDGMDSHNPAGWAFAKGLEVAVDYGRFNFDHGPDLDLYHASALIPFMGGFIRMMGLGISTRNEDFSRGGGTFHIWGREPGGGYGRQLPLPDGIPGRLAFGLAGFPEDYSEVRLNVPGTGTPAILGKSRAHSELGSVRVGLMYKPFDESDLVTVGFQYTHIKDYLKARYPISPTGPIGEMSDIYHVNLFTVGVAVKPDDKTTLTVQHLSGRASGTSVGGNPGNSATYDYFSVGAERVIPVTEQFSLAVRGGAQRGRLTWGIGAELPGGMSIDYALMTHHGHELRKAFGRGPLHIIGVGKRF